MRIFVGSLIKFWEREQSIDVLTYMSANMIRLLSCLLLIVFCMGWRSMNKKSTVFSNRREQHILDENRKSSFDSTIDSLRELLYIEANERENILTLFSKKDFNKPKTAHVLKLTLDWAQLGSLMMLKDNMIKVYGSPMREEIIQAFNISATIALTFGSEPPTEEELNNPDYMRELHAFTGTKEESIAHSNDKFKRLVQQRLHISLLRNYYDMAQYFRLRGDVALAEEYNYKALDLTPEYDTICRGFLMFHLANSMMRKAETDRHTGLVTRLLEEALDLDPYLYVEGNIDTKIHDSYFACIGIEI